MKSQGNKNGTSTLRPPAQQKIKQKQQQQKAKQQEQQKMPTKGGIRIGDYKDKDKWRCKTCKYLNDINSIQCTTCGDPKPGNKIYKKQKIEQQQNQQEKQLLNKEQS